MNVLVFMIPAALALGGLGLVGFIWSLRTGQFDDPQGDAARVLRDDERPL